MLPPKAVSQEDYDKAEDAFLEGEFPPLGEDDLQPLAAAAAPAAPGVEPPPAVAAAPTVEDEAQRAAQAEFDAWLDKPVPATEKYPKKFHGQPMRKLVESVPEADRYIGETRTQLAAKHDELIAAQATARVLFQQMQQLRAGGAAAAPGVVPDTARPAADDPMAFYGRHGMKDPFKEFTANPDLFFAKLATWAGSDAVEAVRKEFTARLEPLEQHAGESVDERNLSRLRGAAKTAADILADEQKLTDPALRRAFHDRFEQIFAANDAALARSLGRLHVAGKLDMFTPGAYVGAYREYEKAIGGFSPLASSLAGAAPVIPASTVPNPPSSARTTARVAPSGGKRVSVRQSNALRELANLGGFSKEQLEDFLPRVENEIAAGIGTGMVTQ